MTISSYFENVITNFGFHLVEIRFCCCCCWLQTLETQNKVKIGRMQVFEESAKNWEANAQDDSSNKEQGTKNLIIKLNWCWYWQTILRNEYYNYILFTFKKNEPFITVIIAHLIISHLFSCWHPLHCMCIASKNSSACISIPAISRMLQKFSSSFQSFFSTIRSSFPGKKILNAFSCIKY